MLNSYNAHLRHRVCYPTKIKNPFIYFAEKDGRTHCILGTDHSVGLPWFDQSITEHLTSYQILMTEVFSSIPNVSIVKETPYSHHLCEFLDPYQDQFIKDLTPTLKSFRLDAIPIQYISPCFLVAAFEQVLARFNPEQEGTDLALFNQFREMGKKTVELPNPEVPNAFADYLLNEEAQLHDEMTLCQYLEKNATKIKNYYDSIQCQILHLSESTDYFITADLTDEKIVQKMIPPFVIQNNQDWAEIFSKKHDEEDGSILLACGHGHLMRPRGDGKSIPDLLREKGFQLTLYKPGIEFPSLFEKKGMAIA